MRYAPLRVQWDDVRLWEKAVPWKEVAGPAGETGYSVDKPVKGLLPAMQIPDCPPSGHGCYRMMILCIRLLNEAALKCDFPPDNEAGDIFFVANIFFRSPR